MDSSRTDPSNALSNAVLTLWLVDSCHVTSKPRPMSSNHRSGSHPLSGDWFQEPHAQ